MNAGAHEPQFRSRHNATRTLVAVCILFGVSLSYVGKGQFSLLGYSLALLGIMASVLIYNIPALGRVIIVVVISVAAVIWSMVSIALSPYQGEQSDAIQALAYPIIALGLILFGWGTYLQMRY